MPSLATLIADCPPLKRSSTRMRSNHASAGERGPVPYLACFTASLKSPGASRRSRRRAR